MIYLNKGFFKPALIISSIPLLPLMLASWIMLVAEFKIDHLAIAIFISLFYGVIAFFLHRFSRTKKHYMSIDEGSLLIKAPGECLEIQIVDIVKIEYYKISSFRSWLLLFNSIGPQSAFVTYKKDGQEISEHIGYPKIEEIRKLCNDYDITLDIK